MIRSFKCTLYRVYDGYGIGILNLYMPGTETAEILSPPIITDKIKIKYEENFMDSTDAAGGNIAGSLRRLR